MAFLEKIATKSWECTRSSFLQSAEFQKLRENGEVEKDELEKAYVEPQGSSLTVAARCTSEKHKMAIQECKGMDLTSHRICNCWNTSSGILQVPGWMQRVFKHSLQFCKFYPQPATHQILFIYRLVQFVVHYICQYSLLLYLCIPNLSNVSISISSIACLLLSLGRPTGRMGTGRTLFFT